MGPLLQTPVSIDAAPVANSTPVPTATMATAAGGGGGGAGGGTVLGDIQAKLAAANEEREGAGQDVSTLQQEENMAISGSNARLMIMKKLSRKQEVIVTATVLRFSLPPPPHPTTLPPFLSFSLQTYVCMCYY